MNRPFVVVLIVVLVLDWPTRFSRTRTTTRTIQFMVPMRGGKTVEAFHEPQKVAQASCLFGADRLEACPTLQPAARFMAPTHVRFLEVFASHEPDFGRDIALRCPRPRSSGRHHCAAERGADGAARRPYQVQGPNARLQNRGNFP